MCAFSLRPHHLLCLRFFEGKGYSEDFTQNARRVLDALQAGERVTLTDSCDALCGACPHNLDGACDTAEKVTRYDAAVLARLPASVGETRSWRQWQSTVADELLAKGGVGSVCGDCEWFALCRDKP